MRIGKYWSEENIDTETKNRIHKILNGEYDESIRDRVRDKSLTLNTISDFSGLPVWLASYVIYDRHSEDENAHKWVTPDKIELLPHHSLRNPIVEQVINETLQVVRDIWKYHGRSAENFFDEIHIELGREMKNPAEKRKQMTNQINENENTNLRIKALLIELMNDNNYENVRPYSPMQQEILKIYEEGALNATDEIPDDIIKIAKQAHPTASELTKYKLWLQQKYRSPYTGDIIPLNKLFTRAYDIEHIIPQARYFDDSFSNKVICEVEVNKDKDRSVAYEYMKANAGKKIELSFGKETTLLKIDQYEDFVKNNYAKNRSKMKKLLMEDIPEEFIQRQLNDTRYISKVVKNLLSNIVRVEGEEESLSKNVVVSSGAITSTLKQDWGLNDIWNEIITPRFERLNQLTNSNNFGEWTNKDGKRVFQTQVPLELQKGFSKKRIDHRHHALDAIVIACASRSHINYLNNESPLGKKKTREEKEKTRYDLKHKLCFKKYNDDTKQNYKWSFFKPWETFAQDSKEVLRNIIVSFKQNLRVINKTTNQYLCWKEDSEGTLKKELVLQTNGQNWAIRKPMHKDTVAGLIKLKLKKIVSLATALDNWEMVVNKDLRNHIKEHITQGHDKKKIISIFKAESNLWNGTDISKVEVYYWDHDNVASRVSIDGDFKPAGIGNITDSGIRKIMKNHLEKYNENAELAFSPDGIEAMNKDITLLNGGKPHKPIYKVRTFESRGNKFAVGQTGNKKNKYVVAAKGTNLFFAIYQSGDKKRSYETVPLNIIIERQKQGLTPVPEENELGHKLLFHLSPNDLVYVPNEEELKSGNVTQQITHSSNKQPDRIYKVVSFTGSRLHCIPNAVATSIIDKVEFTQLNKLEFSLDKIPIKEACIKLKINRLGI